jgi:hypothetical protein
MATALTALALLAASPAIAQDWHDAYRAGLATLASGDPARAVEALQRAITLRPEPGRNVLTYGTNVEPRYFPTFAWPRRASRWASSTRRARRSRGRLPGRARAADERQALGARLEAAAAARRPPPTPAPTPTPTPPSTPASPPQPGNLATSTPAAAPTAAATPTPALAPPQPPPPASTPTAVPKAVPPPGTTSPGARPRVEATGSIEVVSQPAGASVYVDDEPVGSTDPGTGRLVKSGLARGRHRVRVAHAGHEDTVRELDVSGGTVTFYTTLRPSAAEAPDSRTPLLAFALLAVVVTGFIAWIALRRPSHPARPGRASLLSRAETNTGAPATPRTFINPGARLDEQGREWFGDYRLLEMLGRGGMASVFKAERREELVALKRPLASFLDDQPFLDRFLREAEIGRTLNHPNIVRILERGNVLGVPYFTMQLVPGETLTAFMRREGPVEPRFAALFVVQIAEALDFAHGKGVVHRDLKPSNIMRLPDGSARVMDFGIAAPAVRGADRRGLPGYAGIRGAGDDRGAARRRG